MGKNQEHALSKELLPMMMKLRREIHHHPELGLSNPNTQRLISEALPGDFGSIRLGRGQTTWLTFTLRSEREGPNILLRADTDALPIDENKSTAHSSQIDGVMHACGHDLHTSMAVGAAHVLCSTRNEWDGNITVLFQPGEEGFFGAEHCLADGAIELSEFDAVFALHVDPKLLSGHFAVKSGELLAGSDTFMITVNGIGGHASEPHLGRDPIAVACEIALALQIMVTRTVDPFKPAVITVSKIEGGSTRNVMPSSAQLIGTIRSFSQSNKELMRTSLQRVADGICSAHDVSCQVSFTRGYSPTINDPRLTDLVTKTTFELFGHSRIETLATARMGSEDFSTYLGSVPGVMTMIGCRKPETSLEVAAPLHSDQFDPDENTMADGAAFLASVASMNLRTLHE
jgi:hippurate hydrolase